MSCLLLHSWSTWSKPQVVWTRLLQFRTCLTCGKTESRSVE